jgi:transposase InsO family protein
MTLGGRHYFLQLVDDTSLFLWVVLLLMKAAAADAIKHVQAAVEKEGGLKLQVLHTNNWGKVTTSKFTANCVDEGIQCHYSTSYSPQQNSAVKHWNQTVVATAHNLLKQRGMLVEFWGEAVMTVVHLLNRSPTKSLEGKTPYDSWHGRTPAVKHLRTFGCLAYVKELNAIGKLSGTGALHRLPRHL